MSFQEEQKSKTNPLKGQNCLHCIIEQKFIGSKGC